MADGKFATREIRYIIHDHSVEVFVRLDADHECPIGIQGWHYRHFVDGVVTEPEDVVGELKDGRWSIMSINAARALLWPQQAPKA